MADTDDCSTGFSDDMRESRELEEEDRGTATTLTGSDSYVDLEKHTSGVLRAETTPTGDRAKLTAWILVNTLATIGIVFTNKAIFSTTQFRKCQLSFASFHFLVTSMTLHVLSHPFVPLFTPTRIRVTTMLPLAVTMCLNVLLMNLSLTFSSVTLYQITRILLSPAVAAINFLFYGMKIPIAAVVSLFPMVLGVGAMTYYEPQASAVEDRTGSVEVALALGGVIVSAIYMVWIASYQRKLDINAFQLLYNQAPIGSVLLLAMMPWTDSVPSLSATSSSIWMMILLSTTCAVLINISQFFIIAGAGPVSSTVAGHIKTCAIVMLGWIFSGKKVSNKSMFGVLVAIASIFIYSIIMLKSKR